MTSEPYNGWRNYETWCVNLWISNDQGAHEELEERAGRILEETRKGEHKLELIETQPFDDAVRVLAQSLQDEFEVAAQDKVGEASVFADLLSAALGSVDWREIAKHYLDSVLEGEERAKGVLS